MKLRSPDSNANPYIAYALLIYAGMDGISRQLDPGAPTNIDLIASGDKTSQYKKLPLTLLDARSIACQSSFVRKILGDTYMNLISLMLPTLWS